MTVTLLPQAELLLAEFLRAQDELTDLVGDHIFLNLPAQFDGWPAVRITRYGGLPVTQKPMWLDAATVQVDVFGGPQKTAHDIAATCRAVIADRFTGTYDDGVVTGVDFGGLAYVPDQPSGRPRYLFTLTIYVHPNPNGGGS